MRQYKFLSLWFVLISILLSTGSIQELVTQEFKITNTSWSILFSVLEMMRYIILMKLFSNSSTQYQVQKSIYWKVWTLYLRKMECTMLILYNFFNSSILVDYLLFYFVSRLAVQLSYWGTWIQKKDFTIGQE